MPGDSSWSHWGTKRFLDCWRHAFPEKQNAFRIAGDLTNSCRIIEDFTIRIARDFTNWSPWKRKCFRIDGLENGQRWSPIGAKRFSNCWGFHQVDPLEKQSYFQTVGNLTKLTFGGITLHSDSWGLYQVDSPEERSSFRIAGEWGLDQGDLQRSTLHSDCWGVYQVDPPEERNSFRIAGLKIWPSLFPRGIKLFSDCRDSTKLTSRKMKLSKLPGRCWSPEEWNSFRIPKLFSKLKSCRAIYINFYLARDIPALMPVPTKFAENMSRKFFSNFNDTTVAIRNLRSAEVRDIKIHTNKTCGSSRSEQSASLQMPQPLPFWLGDLRRGAIAPPRVEAHRPVNAAKPTKSASEHGQLTELLSDNEKANRNND